MAKGKRILDRIAPRLPNASKATIRRAKISEYLLNPKKSKGKHRFLQSLGYNMRNQSRLQDDIRNGLKGNEASVFKKDAHGNVAYQVVMEIGIGKKATVITAWTKAKGSRSPEFTTLRPAKKKDRT